MQESAVPPVEQENPVSPAVEPEAAPSLKAKPEEAINPDIYILILYLGLIAVFEILGAFLGLLTSVVGHAMLVWVLINHASMNRDTSLGRVLQALVLLPLTRILSSTLPLNLIPPVYWYVLISLPLIAGVWMITRNLGLSLQGLKLKMEEPAFQVLFAFTGIPIGLFGYLILKPAPLFADPSAGDWLLALIVLFVCVALLEEIIYRGLLLHLTLELDSQFAIVLSSLLFAFMFAGSASLAFATFMGAIGAIFAWWTLKYKSIWGAVLAHWLAVVGLLVFWPVVFR